jgi:4a-hydroxytetrahydrobiopterin dehydratase
MWKEIDNKLYQKFTFKDFVEAFAFMTKVAIISEKLNHHATITNTYNTVELWLTTHDAGNAVTEKDMQLSKKISELLNK